MRHDLLADVFCVIKNAESIGRKKCIVSSSKLIKGVLKIIHQHKYIGGFEPIKDTIEGKIKVKLIGKINNCNVIKPQFYVKKDEFIKFEKRFLPAANVGLLILTTPKGIMDQNEAKEQGTGGKLLGYIY